jgi:hypothetical protein
MRHARAYLLSLTTLAAVTIVLPSAARADECSGHQLLSKPRPENSCQTLAPKIYASPDHALHAVVLPVDVSLNATPDMESRVVFRTAKGDTLTSKDYSSPRGANGYYVVNAQWSPDSQFFVFSMSSSGGHSPWSYPTMVYSREKNAIAKLSVMIDGRPLLSADFSFAAPHTLTATTWKKEGGIEDKVPVTVDLATAFAKLPPSSD